MSIIIHPLQAWNLETKNLLFNLFFFLPDERGDNAAGEGLDMSQARVLFFFFHYVGPDNSSF